MKILVTGAGTLVGNTISIKIPKKHKVFSSYNKTLPKNLKKFKNITTCKIDLTKEIKFNKNFDILVHCASLVPAKTSSKKLFYNVNILGFKKLLELSKKNNCKKIILLSTMSVYGEIKSNTITEKTKFNNPDSYGMSKIKMEKSLEEFSKKNNMSGFVLRLPGILGNKSKHNFLSNSLNIIKKKKKILINNPDLLFNNLVHVDNIAGIVINSFNKKFKFQIFNIASLDAIKFKNIFKMIFKKLRIKEHIIINKKTGGFNIKLNEKLKKNYKIYSTRYAIKKFLNENL